MKLPKIQNVLFYLLLICFGTTIVYISVLFIDLGSYENISKWLLLNSQSYKGSKYSNGIDLVFIVGTQLILLIGIWIDKKKNKSK